MPKSFIDTKGCYFKKMRFQIPYYTTTPLFNSDAEMEESKVKSKKDSSTIKLPIKITSKGDESRSTNITHFEIKQAISHFDNNIIAVPNPNPRCLLPALNQRLLKILPSM